MRQPRWPQRLRQSASKGRSRDPFPLLSGALRSRGALGARLAKRPPVSDEPGCPRARRAQHEVACARRSAVDATTVILRGITAASPLPGHTRAAARASACILNCATRGLAFGGPRGTQADAFVRSRSSAAPCRAACEASRLPTPFWEVVTDVRWGEGKGGLRSLADLVAQNTKMWRVMMHHHDAAEFIEAPPVFICRIGVRWCHQDSCKVIMMQLKSLAR